MTATLIYCYDPMCSWCWGFKPTWLALQSALTPLIDANKLSIQPMLGGLAVDSDAPMPAAMQQGLEQTWQQISAQLGSQFNFDFWRLCQPRRSTYPACRACLVARELGLEAPMEKAIQEAYYLQAQNPSDLATLSRCAAQLGMNLESFQLRMQQVNTQGLLETEVAMARQLGLNSFPSLALKIDDQLTSIALDYLSPEPMFTQIKRLLAAQ